MKTLQHNTEEYYARAKGSTSPTDLVDYLVSQGHSRLSSIEAMLKEFDLTDDEYTDWEREIQFYQVNTLWDELVEKANALGVEASGQWANYNDDFNITLHFTKQ